MLALEGYVDAAPKANRSPLIGAIMTTGTIPLITESELKRAALTRKGKLTRAMFLYRPLFHPSVAIRMPLLALSRARLIELELNAATSVLPFALTNRNPFGSMYFAAQLMAAELACGGLVLLHDANHEHNFSPIVKHIDVEFMRAGFDDITYHCDQGVKAARLLERAMRTKDRVEETFNIEGSTPKDGVITRVSIVWSARFKPRG